MSEIDKIESKISLLEDCVDFEEIIESVIIDLPTDENDVEVEDVLEYRKNQAEALLYRFENVYELDILSHEDGYSILSVSNEEKFRVKKYLHKFLVYKNLTGGKDANKDGSAELFEYISANAVKNFLGQGTDIIMVGEGRSNLKEQTLIEITKKLNENKGVYHNLPTRAKDDGVDFIAYKPIDKRNIGNLVVLGQACVGKCFLDKHPIYERWENEYISYAVKPPTTLLSLVNYLDPHDLRSVQSRFRNAIVFDRARIIKYYDVSDETLNKRIIKFVKSL